MDLQILDDLEHIVIGCLKNNLNCSELFFIINIFYYVNNSNGLNKTRGKSVLPVFG